MEHQHVHGTGNCHHPFYTQAGHAHTADSSWDSLTPLEKWVIISATCTAMAFVATKAAVIARLVTLARPSLTATACSGLVATAETLMPAAAATTYTTTTTTTTAALQQQAPERSDTTISIVDYSAFGTYRDCHEAGGWKRSKTNPNGERYPIVPATDYSYMGGRMLYEDCVSPTTTAAPDPQ